MPEVEEKIITIDKWYGGIVRDEKSNRVGALLNAEEVDIFENADFLRATQIMSADSMPANTEIYAYTADDDDVVYGYGRDTTNNSVRIVKVVNGGADNPGAFTTLFTSSDTINLYKIDSDFKWFKTSEDAAGHLYYVKGTGSTWYLVRYNLSTSAEERWDGSSWTSVGALDSNSQLTGLTNSYDRITMKVIYGELFITHGQFIAKVDSDGGFDAKAWTAPREWQAVDIIPVSDVAIVLARNVVRNANYSRGFWWDLTVTEQFDDSFDIPMGGPQWIVNHKENIIICCAIGGKMRWFVMSAAAPGAKPVQIPGIELQNIANEISTQQVSHPKMVAAKDRLLYFGVYKTDKTGIYVLGQIDDDKPFAIALAKRFDTSDYSLHTPRALHIQGPNWYAAFDDNGTADNSRCEENNSPSRSSNATISTVIIDDGRPFQNKHLKEVYIASKPLGTGESLDLYVATDYGSMSQVTRPDGSVFNTLNGLLGWFLPTAHKNKKVIQLRVDFTSNGSSSPYLTALGLRILSEKTPRAKAD